jgi:hypothetical protein
MRITPLYPSIAERFEISRHREDSRTENFFAGAEYFSSDLTLNLEFDF